MLSASNMLLGVEKADDGLRLDLFVSKQLPDYSRSRIQAWLEAQNQKSSRSVRTGEVIEIFIPEPAPTGILAQDLPLDIIYQDEDLVVINKRAGMVVHPGAGNWNGTLLNALLHHFPGLSVGDRERPGIVHRLDKNTSGLMLVAKHDQSHQALSLAFKNREVRKIYRAWCVGNFEKMVFELQTGHKRHPTQRKRFTTKQATQRVAHSRFTVIVDEDRVTKYSELFIEIFTGRTHQIRAQLADIGHPLLGDLLYQGPKIAGFDRHALHAEELHFKHPVTQKDLSFQVSADFDTSLWSC